MNQAEKIKEMLRRTFQEAHHGSEMTEMDERILSDASTTMKQAVAANQRVHPISVWSNIMKSRITKLTTAAVIIFAVALSVTILDRSATPAWSVEQTIAAIEQVKNVEIKGTALWGPDSRPVPVNFSFWVQSPGEDSEPIKMRFECEKRIFVVRGNVAYECWPKEKIAKIKDGPEITDLKYWYKAAELSPWLTGKMLKNLKLFTDDWQQVIDTDPVTGKEQISIKCSYRPSNTSFFIVVDPESKLIRRAKLWKNLEWKGRACVDAQTFVYNQEIADEVFEIPSGMTIVNEKEIEESDTLVNQGEHLFHNEKKYAEALEVYQQVYDRFPELNVAEEALMMVGLCHRRLGQHDKEIEAYQKAISEYPHLKGWIDATYFYLGRAYMEQGQKEKALKAFENCLVAGEGVRDPDKFPLKDAREHIAKIKGE